MIRVSISYPRKDDARFDLDYYINTHMPLVTKLYGDYGLFDWHVDKGISLSSKVPSNNVVVCYSYFDTLDHVKAAFKKEGTKVMQDVPHFTDIEPVIDFGQIHGSAK